MRPRRQTHGLSTITQVPALFACYQGIVECQTWDHRWPNVLQKVQSTGSSIK